METHLTTNNNKHIPVTVIVSQKTHIFNSGAKQNILHSSPALGISDKHMFLVVL